MTDLDHILTPKMAIAGRDKLIELGYQDVDFTDAQKVYEVMRAVAPPELDQLRERVKELEKALDDLLDLNDNHALFGGELYRDRVDRAWEAARRVREGGKVDVL